VIEAVEKASGAADVPVQTSRAVTNAERQLHVARHLWEELHRSRVGLEVVGLIESLPAHVPEELVLHEWAASVESNLMAMERIVVAFLQSGLLRGHALIAPEVKDRAMRAVAAALGRHINRARRGERG